MSTNGIDVEPLLQTIDAIKHDPRLAAFTFRATTSSDEGTYGVGRIGGFVHAAEEDRSRAAPFVLAGDQPPVLLGFSDEVRAGLGEIRAKAFVGAPGERREELEELCAYVRATSPVEDALANAVPVTTTIEVRA